MMMRGNMGKELVGNRKRGAMAPRPRGEASDKGAMASPKRSLFGGIGSAVAERKNRGVAERMSKAYDPNSPLAKGLASMTMPKRMAKGGKIDGCCMKGHTKGTMK